MKPQLQRVEIETARRRNDDFAVDNAAVGQRSRERVMQLRKIAIERPKIAALDQDVGSAAENERPEAVPLGLVQVRADRQLFRELGEHRVERWRNSERRRRLHASYWCITN